MSDYEITNFELRVLLRHYWRKNLGAKAVAKAWQEFFDSKPKEWYFDQIRKLADRWQKVVDNNGLYFEE